jgi:hypothetical protein
MCTSSVLVGPNQCGSQASSMIRSLRRTSPAFAIRMCNRSNSRAASSIGLSSLVTVREGGSRRSAPISIGAFLIPAAAAPHDGSDPRRELAGREGLDDVVVSAELEPEHPIDLLAPGREHHDRDIGLLADLPCEISAVSIGKHHVEQHEIGRLPSEGLTRAGERGRDLGLEPITLEAFREWFPDGLFVFDQKDTGPHGPMVLVDLSFLTGDSWRPKNGFRTGRRSSVCYVCRRCWWGSPSPEPADCPSRAWLCVGDSRT